MHHIELYNLLKKVPFLKLGTIDNFQELKAEVINYKDKVKYQPFVQETAGKEFGNDGYMGLDLSPIYENEFYQFNDTSETHIKKIADYIKENGGYYPKFDLQETGKNCPIIKSTIDNIIEVPSSCRLSRLPAYSEVMWHRHYFIDIVPNCTEIVLHIPVITNTKVVAKVSPYINGANKNVELYTQHFGEGELWYLNPWHFHIFENTSDHDRYHIWMNAYLNHPNNEPYNFKLNRLLETAIKKYRGPWIKHPGAERTHIEKYNFFEDYEIERIETS